MSNDLERIASWWTELDDQQREAAAEVADRLPTWMAISLANTGVELSTPTDVPARAEPAEFVTPRAFKEFIAEQFGR